MHSRQTFTAPRRVLASLWAEPISPIEPGDAFQKRALPRSSALPLIGATGRILQKAGRRLPLRLRGGAVVQGTGCSLPLRLRGGAVTASSGALEGLTLRTGSVMPAVGLGLWKTPKEASAQAVVDAVRAGYRHFDCACDYGNEREVGEGLRQAMDAGLVTRDELWITSKLWNTYHAAEHVEPACRKSLADLGLDYLDLYLVHFPISLAFVPFEERYPPEWIHDPDAAEPAMKMVSVPMSETWTAMEGLVSSGLSKNIGVCNMGTAAIRDLLSYATVPPAVLQVELHLYNQQPKLVRFASEQGIALTGFSPLGAGSYVSIGMATDQDSALTNPTVVEMASKYGRSPAQIILRWALQRGCSVVPKSTRPERLAENLELGGFLISEEDMTRLASLDQRRRFNDPGEFCLGMGAFCPIFD